MFLQGTEELGAASCFEDKMCFCSHSEERQRQSSTPQHLLQLLCVMSVVIQGTVGWFSGQVLPLPAGGEVEKVGKGLSLAFSKHHFKWK